MKIECDKCGAKYSIADEKVRGKTFKIRCKKCSNVIIVRDKSAAAAADAGAAAEAAPAAEEAAGWHLAIDGQTIGPIAEDEVRARYADGEIDKETSVWQEGFEDWLTLGEVDVFADLPDRAAAPVAAAADPFGGGASDDAFSGGGEDAFGGGGGGFSDGPQRGGAAGAAPVGAESPRVSSLTGQRNENSVLFSLDNLQALATGGGAASAPSGGGGGGGLGGGGLGGGGLGGGGGGGFGAPSSPSISAPTSEGSGLIDIRAMGAMIGGSDAGGGGGGGLGDLGGGDSAAPAAGGALPSFGGGGFGGLSAAPLVAEAPAEAAVAAAPVEEQKSGMGLLIAMVAIMFLAVVGMGIYMFTKEEPKPEQVVKIVEVPGAATDEKDSEKDSDKDESDSEKESAEDEGETGDADEAGAEAATGVAGSSTSGTKKKKKRKKSTGTSSAGTTGGSTGTTAPSGDVPKKAEPKKDDISVDCLLDPSKCGGSGGSKPKPSSTGSSSGPPKLGATEIKAGIAPVKSKASACGPKHGGAAGTKVEIKFSVSGSSGKVTSASAQGAHAGTPLGNCVAAAAKSATFSKFQAPSQGFRFKFKM